MITNENNEQLQQDEQQTAKTEQHSITNNFETNHSQTYCCERTILTFFAYYLTLYGNVVYNFLSSFCMLQTSDFRRLLK